jgi:hypothetical protein
MSDEFQGLEKIVSTVTNIPSRISNWLKSVSWETPEQTEYFKDIKTLSDLNNTYKSEYNTQGTDINQLNIAYQAKRHVIAKNFVLALQDIKRDFDRYTRPLNKQMIIQITREFDQLLKQFKVYNSYAGTQDIKDPLALTIKLIQAYEKVKTEALNKYNELSKNKTQKVKDDNNIGNNPFTTSKVKQIVYHGTLPEDIQTFDPKLSGTRQETWEKMIYFTNDYDTAKEFSAEKVPTQSKFILQGTGKFGKVYPAYINLQKPLDLRNLTDSDKQFIIESYAEGYGVDLEEARESMQRMNFKNHQMVKITFNAKQLEKAGYDGLIAAMYPGSNIIEFGVIDEKDIKIITEKNESKTQDVFLTQNRKPLKVKIKK